jgi:WD40 repeat protein
MKKTNPESEEKKELALQAARQHALVSVQQFEAEARLACVPERSDRPIITNMHSLTMQRYCYSPDGKKIAVASRTVVYLWDLPTQKIIQTYDAGEWIEALVFSPDGKTLITGGADNVIRYRDVVGGQCLKEIRRHERRILRIKISPDGRWLVTGDYYAIGIWDLKSGVCRHWMDRMSEDGIEDFTFSADSRFLYLGVGKTIKLLEIESGRIIREIQRPQKLQQIAASDDGKTLFTKEGSHYVLRIVDVETEAERRIEGCNSVLSFTLSSDGKILATGHEDEVRLWDSQDGSPIAVIEDIPASFSPIAFSPDSGQFLVRGRGLQRHDIQAGQTQTIISMASSRCDCSVFACDGRVLVTDGPDTTYNVWDLRTGKIKTRLPNPVDPYSSVRVYPSGHIFVFSPDSALLVGRTSDKTILVWDMHYGRCVRVIGIDQRAKKPALVIHPNGRTIAYNDGDQIILRDLRTDDVKTFTAEGLESLRSLTFTDDGRYLISLDQEHLRQWDLESGQCLRTVRFLDFCTVSEGNFLSFVHLVDPQKLTFILGEFSFEEKPPKKLWDPLTGQCLQTFEGFDGGQIVVLPDKKTFLCYDRQNRITQWSIETGKCLREIEGVPENHDFNHIVDLILYPDQSVLIAATCEGVMYFWDFASGKLLGTGYNLPEGHLWTTPPDDFATSGWLHTDRPDLVSLQGADKHTGAHPEFITEEDERFADYMRLYNDGEMVMNRINNWGRYQELLRLRLNSKEAMADKLLMDGKEVRLQLMAEAKKGEES